MPSGDRKTMAVGGGGRVAEREDGGGARGRRRTPRSLALALYWRSSQLPSTAAAASRICRRAQRRASYSSPLHEDDRCGRARASLATARRSPISLGGPLVPSPRGSPLPPRPHEPDLFNPIHSSVSPLSGRPLAQQAEQGCERGACPHPPRNCLLHSLVGAAPSSPRPPRRSE